MTRAPEIWSQLTGIPSHGSEDPQRPTPMRTYGACDEARSSLKRPISSATSLLAARSKRSMSTYTTSLMFASTPSPRTCVLWQIILDSSASSMRELSAFVADHHGTHLQNAEIAGLAAGDGQVRAANSISTDELMPRVPTPEHEPEDLGRAETSRA